MKFGVFDHMDSSGEPLRELLENRLRLAQAYDRAGIHALHVAEHHSTPLGMSPSPSVFLALVAQRTRRLRFTNLSRRRNTPLPKNISYSEDFDGIVASGQAIAGSPRTVRDAIARQTEEAGVNYVLMRFAFGDMSLEESLRSVDLFAREVMPGFAAAVDAFQA